jgi:hypothetical protein
MRDATGSAGGHGGCRLKPGDRVHAEIEQGGFLIWSCAKRRPTKLICRSRTLASFVCRVQS